LLLLLVVVQVGLKPQVQMVDLVVAALAAMALAELQLRQILAVALAQDLQVEVVLQTHHHIGVVAEEVALVVARVVQMHLHQAAAMAELELMRPQ
jgi:hypothetical protein